MAQKRAICIRMNPEILEWFKGKQPRGYQTLINSVLEKFVRQQSNQEQRNSGRAQEIFKQFHARCFWHYDPDLIIVPENLHLVVAGLRKYGGKEGLKLAEELCR